MNSSCVRKAVCILLCCLSVIVCSCREKVREAPLLRLAYAPHDHHSPLYIAALNSDYFKKHGGLYLEEVAFKQKYNLIEQGKVLARLEISSSTGGKEIIRKLSEGQYDVSFGGVPAVLHFVDRGANIKIIAPVMAEGAGLVVKTGLPADNWQEFIDLARKREQPLRIGYKMAVSTHNLIFEHALTLENIPFATTLDSPGARIQVINLYGAHNLLPALEGGLIDGYVVNQPYLALAEFKGLGKTIALFKDLPPNGKWAGHPCCALAADESYINDYPEVTVALTTLFMRANKFIRDNGELSQKQIANWLELPVEVEKRSLPTILFTNRIDDQWQAGVRFWVDALIESGKFRQRIDKTVNGEQLNKLIYDFGVYQKAFDRI